MIDEDEESEAEVERSNRSLFVQELLLSTLTEHLTVSDNSFETLDKVEESDTLKHQGSEVKANEHDKSDNGLPDGAEKDKFLVASSKNNSSEHTSSGIGASGNSKTIGHKTLDKVGTKQKSLSLVASLNGRGGASGTVVSRGVRQSSIPYQSQGERHSHALHNVRMQNPVDLSNNLSLNMGRGRGASYDTENPQPLPGRPGSGGRDRDLHPSTAKRNMVKHYPATKASDREPPPH